MPSVLPLLVILPAAAFEQQATPPLISDSPEYCAELSSRFAALEIEAPTDLRALAEGGGASFAPKGRHGAALPSCAGRSRKRSGGNRAALWLYARPCNGQCRGAWRV